jgi:hypothetical protein
LHSGYRITKFIEQPPFNRDGRRKGHVGPVELLPVGERQPPRFVTGQPLAPPKLNPPIHCEHQSIFAGPQAANGEPAVVAASYECNLSSCATLPTENPDIDIRYRVIRAFACHDTRNRSGSVWLRNRRKICW